MVTILKAVLILLVIATGYLITRIILMKREEKTVVDYIPTPHPKEEAYPRPIRIFYWYTEDNLQEPWRRYRDEKGRYIKKELALNLYHLKNSSNVEIFHIDEKVYMVISRLAI